MANPTIIVRVDQPYVARRCAVTMATLASVAEQLPAVLEWLTVHEIRPAGPPFFKYDVIDMAREMVVQAGVPTNVPVEPGEGLIAGVLPAGRYATVTHVGHPDQLVAATAALLAWADQRDERWDMTVQTDGEHWGCRLENWLTDPSLEPDMNQWHTELAFRLQG